MLIKNKLRYNDELWIGNSDALFTLKQQIKKLACATIPVHIVGEPGTGKLLAAHHIHKLATNSAGEFVVSCCKTWNKDNVEKELEAKISQAKEGTLYIKNVDSMSLSQFDAIKGYWLDDDNNAHSVRLITSSAMPIQSADLSMPTPDNFLNWLHYHCLELLLPTLCERQEDIAPLIDYYKSLNSNIAKLIFSDDALALLRRYGWPNNVKQLKRCLDKLVFADVCGEISANTLLGLFPAMNAEANLSRKAAVLSASIPHSIDASMDIMDRRHSTIPNRFQSQQDQPQQQPQQGHPQKDSLLINLALNQATEKSKYHPALLRAIVHVEENYTKPLRLKEVADHACVSPSHLSYLFKRYVGQSFKQTLLRLRINAAMTLLRDNPFSQVTEVCHDVGFSDLSFFVRKFKSVVGFSPGVYRDQHAKN